MSDFKWLIEAPGQRYLAVQRLSSSDNFEWTSDHDRALKFCSQEQADAMMMALRQMDRELDSLRGHGNLSWGKLFAFETTLGNARAVEHGWIGVAPPEPTEGNAAGLLNRAMVRLAPAAIGSCTCETKNDDLAYHRGDCRARLIELAIRDVADARTAITAAPSPAGEG